MSNIPAAAELAAELIRRPSVTPDDAGCQALIAERLSALGFRCESMPFGEVDNLWARRGDEGPVFCFAGHTDVVPPGPASDWDGDPFTPRFDDGMLHGRGAADMKGGLAAMLVAVENLLARRPDLPGSLAFLLTSDEEGPARDGTRRVVETLSARDEHIDFCVIGEPSSRTSLGDCVRIGRRGSLSGQLRILGTQGHVAYPQFADNPIHRFAPVLAKLATMEWDRGNQHFPPTSLQVVNIAAGAGASNVTPGDLALRFNFRYSTEWSYPKLQARVEALLAEHELDFELNWHLSGEPFLTAPGPLIDAVCDSVEAVCGSKPELSTAGGTSDGRFLAPAGVAVVELGPVNATIHKVNECVSVADLAKLTEAYEGIADRLLG